MKQVLYTNWCEKYECPGGDCGLTCCIADWKIFVQKDEIERYKCLNHPFRDELLEAIDEEKGVMKCKEGKCALLDENGYCKLVTNCGPEALSRVCSVFPWREREYGFIKEAVVEIVCPLVAEFLFDSEQVYFVSDEIEGDVTGTPEEANTYMSLFDARKMIMDIFSLCPQQYVHGKAFILFKSFEKIIELNKSGKLSQETVKAELRGYFDEKVISSIFEQCDSIASKLEAKEKIMYQAFQELTALTISDSVLSYVVKHKYYLVEQINKYLKSEEAFNNALIKYTDYIRSEYPMFVENFLVYSLVCSFVTRDKEKIGQEFISRIIELLYIQLLGMAILDINGSIDKKEFSVVIAAIDRVVSHYSKMIETTYDYYMKKQSENQVFFMMLV